MEGSSIGYLPARLVIFIILHMINPCGVPDFVFDIVESVQNTVVSPLTVQIVKGCGNYPNVQRQSILILNIRKHSSLLGVWNSYREFGTHSSFVRRHCLFIPRKIGVMMTSPRKIGVTAVDPILTDISKYRGGSTVLLIIATYVASPENCINVSHTALGGAV